MNRPKQYNHIRKRKTTIHPKKKNRLNIKIIAFFIVIIFIFIFVVKKNTPSNTFQTKQQQTINTNKINCKNENKSQLINNGNNKNIKWPKKGNSSIGSICTEQYWTNDIKNKQIPIASLTKIITILVVLNKNPDLNRKILITPQFAKFYESENRKAGTAMKLKKNSYYTVKELSSASLLVSANNAANILAINTFGSMSEYKNAATKYLFENNIKNTTIGTDACGIDNKTTSTPEDLFKLAELAIKNNDISKIAAKKIVKIHYGKKRIEKIPNMNNLLDYSGYIGIKTGYTHKAGACVLFAKKYKNDVIVGVVTGQKNAGYRLKATVKLVNSFEKMYS
jgi:D-alanyl-D-alanine carboxypeptidase (penicillin-binding protein 5/6)